MITKQEKSAIRQMLQTANWRIAQEVADEMIKGWQNQSKKRDDVYKTAEAVWEDEGKCAGVRSFIQELFKQANDA